MNFLAIEMLFMPLIGGAVVDIGRRRMGKAVTDHIPTFFRDIGIWGVFIAGGARDLWGVIISAGWVVVGVLWLWWKRRRKDRAPSIIGAKSRALIEVLVRNMRARWRPRLSPEPQHG